ncbi:hypothetical protein P692DRAFT_201727755 [Suillus brevipes Sb2]|nr:hypothetical protein P692DRAFT_201727755 [Suillus brevipes Sb2]
MLEFALQYRKAIDTMTDKRRLGLGPFELKENEWGLVAQLRDVLKILKHATLYFSRGSPTLAMVIPAMDHIDSVFTAGIINHQTLNPSIRAALKLAKRTLNRYYSLTDKSETYRIAMVLHPQHKLEYFKAAGWEDEWVTTAHNIVHTEYERSYASRSCPAPGPGEEVTVTQTAQVRLIFCYFSRC